MKMANEDEIKDRLERLEVRITCAQQEITARKKALKIYKREQLKLKKLLCLAGGEDE